MKRLCCLVSERILSSKVSEQTLFDGILIPSDLGQLLKSSDYEYQELL